MKCGGEMAEKMLSIIGCMTKEEVRHYFPETTTDDGAIRFGDSLLPAFGPHRGDAVADALRPHVLA